MSRITINGVSLDPAAEAAAMKMHSLTSFDSSKSDYILIQTKAPLTAVQKAEFVARNVEIREYVPEDTYVCRYKPSDLHSIRSLPFVAWANEYLAGFKIAPMLHAGSPNQTKARLLDLAGPPGSPGAGERLVDIVLHRGVDPKATAVRDAIAAATGIDPQALEYCTGKFRVHVDADRLPEIAKIDVVRNVEAVVEKKMWNDIAIGIVGAEMVHQQIALEGDNQIVAVCDTGFDVGSTSNVHAAFTGRVTKLYPIGRATASDPNGHGTHVCGSVLGDGSSLSLGRIRGAAPKAKLLMQSVLNGSGGFTFPISLETLFQQTYDDGARVHSDSWGASINAYTQESFEVDNFVWEHRDAVIVFAAGNDGTDRNADGRVDAGSLGSPATAKNCITVGATENNRPAFNLIVGNRVIETYGQAWGSEYPVAPLSNDRFADGPNGLAAFSSRGPTADGRIKPDVVAPGTAILSARSRASGVGPGWGPSGDPLYFFESGTSMATPLVSGCAAIVRQHLQLEGVEQPSAALVKAFVINGATPLSGQYTPNETGTIPNNDQGFGRVDLAASIGQRPDSKIVRYWDEAQTLDTGDVATFTAALTHPASAVKVTLVWTDPPGEALQNDLDLVVTSPTGVVMIGNAAPGSAIPDRTNNVEQVVLTHVPVGSLTIDVRAFRIALLPQSFALVVRAVL